MQGSSFCEWKGVARDFDVMAGSANAPRAAWAYESLGKLIRSLRNIARQMPSLIPGRNAIKIALAIDAIEVLLTLDVDTFVIVDSDASSTR